MPKGAKSVSASAKSVSASASARVKSSKNSKHDRKINKSIKKAEHFNILYDQCKEICDLSNLSNDEWVTRLKANESELFNEFPFYPSDYEIACFAEAVYYESSRMEMPNCDENWKLICYGENKNDGYIGAAYWNTKYRHLVIAHKGTQGLSDIKKDINGIIRSNIDSQMGSATKFTGDVLSKMHVTCLSVTVTGHSLGGWLAQITALHMKENLETIHPHVVVFESPGCEKALSKLLSTNDEQVQIEDLDITNYLSTPNYINACGRQVKTATLYHVPSVERPWQGSRIVNFHDYFNHLKEVHSMKNMLNAFDKISGYPKEFYRMTNWPSITIPGEGPMPKPWQTIAILKLIKNLANTNDEKLQEFLKCANILDNLSIIEENSLPFDTQYLLHYSAGFRKAKETEEKIQVKLTAFPFKMREFLQQYLKFKTNFSKNSSDFLLQATHAGFNERGLTQITQLLDDYDIKDSLIIIKSGNKVNFLRYFLHIMRLSPDINILKSTFYEQLVDEIDAKIKGIKESSSFPILANKIGSLVIINLISGGSFFGKDMPEYQFNLMLPQMLENMKEDKKLRSALGKTENQLNNINYTKIADEIGTVRIINSFQNYDMYSNVPSVDLPVLKLILEKMPKDTMTLTNDINMSSSSTAAESLSANSFSAAAAAAPSAALRASSSNSAFFSTADSKSKANVNHEGRHISSPQ